MAPPDTQNSEARGFSRKRKNPCVGDRWLPLKYSRGRNVSNCKEYLGLLKFVFIQLLLHEKVMEQ